MNVDESVTIPVSRERVWQALTDPDDRAEWWHDFDLDPVPGGKLEERWTDDNGTPMLTTGRVTAVSPGEHLRFSWSDERWPTITHVSISLHDLGHETLVRITESGWDAFPDSLAADHRAGWRVHLTNLRRHLSP
ncbi:SRPBCC domain-containing protein [Nonomuraea sp. NPDC050556]|uniref:SRPBCC domain-containing protein n=1 Tax=Nonomuraea sp. NPDC050556 TaxID=3364369 RepID=UPI00379B9AFB